MNRQMPADGPDRGKPRRGPEAGGLVQHVVDRCTGKAYFLINPSLASVWWPPPIARASSGISFQFEEVLG